MKEVDNYIVKIEPGEALDAICFRVYQSLEPWADILNLNPDIANFGDLIPCGYVVKLPKKSGSREVKKIKLWD
jgi:phage tail protein X